MTAVGAADGIEGGGGRPGCAHHSVVGGLLYYTKSTTDLVSFPAYNAINPAVGESMVFGNLLL